VKKCNETGSNHGVKETMQLSLAESDNPAWSEADSQRFTCPEHVLAVSELNTSVVASYHEFPLLPSVLPTVDLAYPFLFLNFAAACTADHELIVTTFFFLYGSQIFAKFKFSNSHFIDFQ
jgi:hypothetical protein